MTTNTNDPIKCPKCGHKFIVEPPITRHCARCGAFWVPRKADPVQCPRCKRVDWRQKEATHANGN